MQKVTTLLLFLSLCLSQASLAQHQSSSRGYLGIHSNSVSKEKAKKIQVDNPYGSYVTRVIPGSAAEQMGLQAFDYVYAINDQATTDDDHLTSLLRAYQPGAEVKVAYVRQGKNYEGRTTLTPRIRTPKRWEAADEPFLGVQASHDRKPRNQDGVRVNIIDNSTAEAMAMEDGDIITAINDMPVYDWHDLSAAIDLLNEGGETIQVAYVRDGESYRNARPIRTRGETYPGHYNQSPERDVEEVLEEARDAIAARSEAIERLLETTEPNIRTDDMEITMDPVTETEAAAMKEERGIDMPIVNNLAIEGLNIFPNPSTGVFNLRFDLAETGPLAIRIFSGQGQLLYQNDLLPFTGRFDDTLDLSDQPTGTYFLMIAQGERSITRRVVIAQP
ncbi:MAG: PDZ domain-containing protein [Bacteroidota bacterium]